MTIYKFLDASTGYVTEDDMNRLSDSGLYCIADYEEGAFVHLPAIRTNGEFDDPEWRRLVREAGYSERFCDLMEYARTQGCAYIRLDRDGDEVPLPCIP